MMGEVSVDQVQREQHLPAVDEVQKFFDRELQSFNRVFLEGGKQVEQLRPDLQQRYGTLRSCITDLVIGKYQVPLDYITEQQRQSQERYQRLTQELKEIFPDDERYSECKKTIDLLEKNLTLLRRSEDLRGDPEREEVEASTKTAIRHFEVQLKATQRGSREFERDLALDSINRIAPIRASLRKKIQEQSQQ